ncbi:hypothetical protein [Tateyamaria sp. SN6-1]|uniref:hypothetical protein n=1 Tax=Tateyamaria sp. SN6-1 TaxID=3092148 RepID=UPI0039F5AC30
MFRTATVLGCAAVLLAACDETVGGAGGNFINPLPEEIVDLAGPNQDLKAVRVDPVDGCLVYRHVGPVETTFLPLRAKSGAPICTRQPEAEAPAPAA